MGWPLVIAAGVAVASAAAQYYQSEKARGASQDELDRLKEMFGEITPPDYDLTIEDPPELHDERLQDPRFSGEMAAPQWNLDKLDPKMLEQVAKFNPEIAPLIKEAAPDIIKQSETMKEGSAAQKTALRRLMKIGEGDFDPEYAQRVQTAKDRSQAEAQSRSASTMQDFERRGIGGSGLELASKMGTNAAAMDRNAAMGMQAETEAYKNQLSALAQGAQLGGQMYAQDEGTQSRNAQIINNFNQRMSKRHQDWEQMRADQVNQADLRNIQEAQRISDENTGMSNKSAQVDRQRMDDITRYNQQFQLGERDRMDDLSRQQYDRDAKQRAYEDARDMMQAKWRQDNTRYGNNLQDQRFQNQVTMATEQAGLGGDRNQLGMQRAQDRNAAIQGVTQAGIMAAGNWGNKRDKPEGMSFRGRTEQWSDNEPRQPAMKKNRYDGSMYS